MFKMKEKNSKRVKQRKGWEEGNTLPLLGAVPLISVSGFKGPIIFSLSFSLFLISFALHTTSYYLFFLCNHHNQNIWILSVQTPVHGRVASDTFSEKVPCFFSYFKPRSKMWWESRVKVVNEFQAFPWECNK